MDKKEFKQPAAASEITAEELEIAQWRVDVTGAGQWKIDQIYAEHWESQAAKTHFGKVFKAAVDAGKLTGISLLRHPDGSENLSPDRQLLYVIALT